MKTSLSIILILLCFVGYSQDAQNTNAAAIDSVIKAVEKMSSADDKIASLSQFTSKLRYGAGSLRLIKKSEEISNKAKTPKLLATTYYYYGNYYYYNSKLDSSLYYIEKSKVLINDDELPFLRSSILNTEGGVYAVKGDMPQALALTLKSREFIDKVDPSTLNEEETKRYKYQQLSLDNSIANFYNQMEEYDKATQYYDKGYKSALKDKSYLAAGVFITNKGDLYLNTEKYELALKAFIEGKN